MFKSGKTTETTETETSESANYWPDRIEALAKEAETDALRDAPKYLAEYRAAHKADAASYRFDCRRHGDFLTVFIERGGEKVATSLNLGKVTRFYLSAGHGPDNKGSLTYRYGQEREEPSAPGGWIYCDFGAGWGRPTPPPQGYRYVVTPRLGAESPRRMVLEAGTPALPDSLDYYPDPRAHHTTPNYPRRAEDDRVIFAGLGLSICAPAGKGQAILDRILKEVERTA